MQALIESSYCIRRTWFNRFETFVIATLVQLRSIFQERKEVSVFNTMTSATTQKINPNNCAHEQLFKASGRVEAYIATTFTKDNICASGKEGIKGNDQTDNHPSLCKPADLFLAFAHIENKLARAWLHKFRGEEKISIDPIATLSEHHVSDNDNGYATLDCFIFMDTMPCRTMTGTTTSLLMEMRKSSCALWIMTLPMANSHMRLVEP
jgi:hypothetical protein